MGVLHHLPIVPTLHVVETSPAGVFDFPAPVSIEITAGHSKVYAVRIDGVIWAEFATATNAIRCRGALETLESLGLLPTAPRAA